MANSKLYEDFVCEEYDIPNYLINKINQSPQFEKLAKLLSLTLDQPILTEELDTYSEYASNRSPRPRHPEEMKIRDGSARGNGNSSRRSQTHIKTQFAHQEPEIPPKSLEVTPYSPDFENSVIQRQRRELQQLVSELRERDRELNDMAANHRRQIEGWETDRKRLVQIEEKAHRFESDLFERQNQCKSLTTRLKSIEEQLEEKNKQILTYQSRIDTLIKETEQYKSAFEHYQNENESLERRIRELAHNIDHMQESEHDSRSQLRIKESEVYKREQELKEHSQRWQLAENNLENQLRIAELLKNQLNEANNCLNDLKKENQGYNNEYSRLTAESRQCVEANEKLQSEIIQLRKDLQLAIEREKRKDDLLQSQRLKQERSNAEIQHLRQLYERMQQDLHSLNSNLDGNSKWNPSSMPSTLTRNDSKSRLNSESSPNSHNRQYTNLPSSEFGYSTLPSKPPTIHNRNAPSSSSNINGFSKRLAAATLATNQLLQKSDQSNHRNLTRVNSLPDFQANPAVSTGNQSNSDSLHQLRKGSPYFSAHSGNKNESRPIFCGDTNHSERQTHL